MAEEGQEVVSVGLRETDIDIRMLVDERGDNVAERTFRERRDEADLKMAGPCHAG
jgi:hypothetical protein